MTEDIIKDTRMQLMTKRRTKMDCTHVPRHLRCEGCHCYMSEDFGNVNEAGDFYCEDCVRADEYIHNELQKKK